MSAEIQAAIFDLGSTLIRFTGDWPQVFAHSLDVLLEALRDEGISLDGDKFRRSFEAALSAYHEQRDRDLVEQTTEVVLINTLSELKGEKPSTKAVTHALDKMYRVSQSHWHPLPASEKVLQELSRRGMRLGLISNASDERDVQQLIDKAGIRAYLNPIIVSASFGLRKPHPDIFLAVLDEWKLAPDSVVMIGDLLEADILGAENVGMRHIWMTEVIDQDEVERPYPVQPDAVAPRLADVPEIIDSLGRKGKSA